MWSCTSFLSKSGRLFAEIARGIEAGGGRAANRQPLPDERTRQEPAILGAPREFDGLLRRFEREMRHPRGVFDLLLQLGVFDHAFEQARPGHQDVVCFLLTELVGLAGLVVGVVQIAAVEMQVAAIHADRSGAAMVGVNLVDLAGAVEMRERLRADFLVIAPHVGLGAPALRGFGVDPFTQLQGDQALDVSHVGERAGEIAMLGITLAVFLDGLGKVPQREIVASFAPVHPAVAGLDVAAGDVVVCFAQDGVGFAQQLQRVFDAAFLKQQPAFRNAHGCRHRLHTGFRCVAIAFAGVIQGVVVFAGFAAAARTPEMREREHGRIGDLAAQGQDKTQVGERPSDVFLRHPDHGFGHQHVGVVEHRKPDAATFREGAQSVLDHIDSAPARIGPLRDVAKQTGCVRMPWIEATGLRPVFVETRHTATDPAHPEIGTQSLE